MKRDVHLYNAPYNELVKEISLSQILYSQKAYIKDHLQLAGAESLLDSFKWKWFGRTGRLLKLH